MSTIPIITPATGALPVSGSTATAVAGANAIAQDITNFLPIFNNASVAGKTAKANAQAAGLDAFHTGLAIFVAVDQAVTPYVPYAPVQAYGGIGALAATLLGDFVPNMTPTAAAVAASVPVSTPVLPVSTAPPTLAQLQAEQAQIAQQIASFESSTTSPSVASVAHTAAAAKETFAQESAGDKLKTIGSLGIFHQTAPAPAEVVNPVAATKP